MVLKIMKEIIKNTKGRLKPSNLNSEGEKVSSYSNTAYFIEKDKQAVEFLRKHPIPKKFLK